MFRYLFHPLLFILLLTYIAVEIVFLTTFTNTLGSHTGLHNFSYFEVFGRNISAFGIGLSFLMLLSTRAISEYPLKIRFWFKAISFVLVCWISSFALKTVFEHVVENASPSLTKCSVIGSIAQSAIDRGNDSYLAAWSDENYFTSIEEFHLGKILTPFSVCMSSNLSEKITTSPNFAENIRALYGELPMLTDAGSLAREPYLQIEKNLEKMQKALFYYTNSRNKDKAIEKIKKDASTNARKFGIEKAESIEAFSEIFSCSVKRAAGAPNYWKAKEALLPSALACNSEYIAKDSNKVSASFVDSTDDLYELGRTVAAHQMAFSLASNVEPANIEELRYLKGAVASMVLPVFIYFVSTFVIVLCIASYFKNRVGLYFLRVQGRVPPVLNFVFSTPFIVILIGIVLWNAPTSQFEENIFPVHERSFSSQVVLIGLRSTFIYYPKVRNGLKKSLNMTPHFYFRSYSIKARYSLIHILKVGGSSSFNNEELVVKFNEAMRKRYYTTPINQSALRYADMLIQQGYLPTKLSEDIENIYQFYKSKNSDRAFYIDNWRTTWGF